MDEKYVTFEINIEIFLILLSKLETCKGKTKCFLWPGYSCPHIPQLHTILHFDQIHTQVKFNSCSNHWIILSFITKFDKE